MVVMNGAMSTKIPKTLPMKLGECTEFQLHKSQQTIFHGILKKVLDYSEYRLLRHIETVKDQQQRLVLIALLHDYINGDVALAWKKGQPVWVKVTKA